MTIKDLKNKKLLLFECISGSRAYGLAGPNSDTDIKGVFVQPQKDFYSLNKISQVNNESNDEVYYELEKFVELLSKNNPNLLEMLASPKDCILYKHPLFEKIKASDFLSQLSKDSFAAYAMTQIKKAKGLNKKILNPMDKERKSVLDFCYVIQGNGSISLKDFLKARNLDQAQCGLVNIAHMQGIYALFAGEAGMYKGIMQSKEANDISLSSVPKGEEAIAYLSFNKNGYSTYCKDYKAYWEWVEKRNDARYQNTLSHGKNYDAKNMMHTFRLLEMAEQIGLRGKVIVRSEQREFLLKIKTGVFAYEDLLKEANEKVAEIDEIFKQSELPEKPDMQKVNQILYEIRQKFYATK